MQQFTDRMIAMIKKYGLRQSAALAARYFLRSAVSSLRPDALLNRANCRALADEILGGKWERVIVMRTSAGYDVPLFQRTQQMARAMAGRGSLVLYEAAPHRDKLRLARRVEKGLWLIDFRSKGFVRLLVSRIEKSALPRWLWLSSPESRISVRTAETYSARGFRTIYDYIDALSTEISVTSTLPKNTVELYRRAMCGKQTVVIVSSLALRRDALEKSGREPILAENGADCAFFASVGECPDDADFRAILERGRPRACFFGALAGWLDTDALLALAADGRFDIVMIGPFYGSGSWRELRREKNVFFLGAKPYAELKDYAARCDVMLIPFTTGAVGDAASPVKLFEYMAIGKPIVSSDIAECRRYGGVEIYRGAKDIVRCASAAFELGRTEGFAETQRRRALEFDWARRAETVTEALRREEKKQGCF